MQPKPQLRSVKKIWDHAEHNALTDLIYYNHHWYCTFRESNQHVFGTNGVIRILVSQDGERWHSHSVVEESGIDLRDPKLSITPDERLMLLVGGTQYRKEKAIARQPRVCFLSSEDEWSSLQTICQPFDWLWRVTWHKGVAWGVSYIPGKEKWRVILYSSVDALNWQQEVEWEIPGAPNETTLRFLEDDTMVALVRRNFQEDGFSWIGTSQKPYSQWSWNQTRHHLGGPNFIVLPNGQMWASGRLVERTPYGYFEKTALCSMTLDKITPALLLPSGGIDCSYPGMAYHNQEIWLSYYSSHEGRTSIYLAKVQLPSD